MKAIDGALLIVALAVAWSFYRAQKDRTITFNLLDLIIENGRVSKLACVFMGAFAVSSWVVIKVALDGKMTEGLFMAYGTVWVAPIIAKLFTPQAAISVTTTTATQTVTQP